MTDILKAGLSTRVAFALHRGGYRTLEEVADAWAWWQVNWAGHYEAKRHFPAIETVTGNDIFAYRCRALRPFGPKAISELGDFLASYRTPNNQPSRVDLFLASCPGWDLTEEERRFSMVTCPVKWTGAQTRRRAFRIAG